MNQTTTQMKFRTVEQELEEVEELRKQQSDAAGVLQWYKISKEGEHEFDIVQPVTIGAGESVDKKPQSVFMITRVRGQKPDEQFQMGIKRINPFCHELLKALKAGKTHFKTLTTGKGIDTRYKILEAM